MQTHGLLQDSGENSDQPEKAVIFTCDDCEIGFSTQRGLKMHRINDHKDDISLDSNECDECGLSFSNTENLNAHIQNEHDNIKAKIGCKQELYDEHRFDHEMNDLSDME